MMMFKDMQKTAEEILVLDPEKDKEVIITKKWELINIALGLSKNISENINEKAHYPLLEPELRGKVPQEDFYKILFKELERLVLEEKYNPAKGSFSNALSFVLNKRVQTYLKKRSGELYALSVEKQREMYGEAREILIEPAFTDEITGSLSVIDALVSFAALIAKSKEMDMGRTVNKKNQFERYFTFYLTKYIKKDDSSPELYTVNDYIFPVLEIVLLEFLMFGTFSHVKDIKTNELKNDDYLVNYKKTLYACYGEPSEATIVKRCKAYNELKKYVIGI